MYSEAEFAVGVIEILPLSEQAQKSSTCQNIFTCQHAGQI